MPKDLKPDFFERLKEVLKALPSLQYAAELTGYSYEQVAKWRDNKARPPFQPLAILAAAAGKSLDWLATGAEPAAAMAQVMTQTVLQQSLAHADVTMIPRLNARVSAGIGLANPDGDEIERVPVSRALLRRLGIQPENAHIIQADGDSMEETIFDQDDVLIDTGDTEIRSEGIYAVQMGELAMIKRVQPLAFIDTLTLYSDNERYAPMTIKRGEVDQFRVIGRAKLVMRVL